MTPRREINGSSKPESLSEQSRHGESYTALNLEPSGRKLAWWEAGDTHYLLNTFLFGSGRCTHEGDAAYIRGTWFERGTYIESICMMSKRGSSESECGKATKTKRYGRSA